jgi:predicted TIM-barrel fold metal-dependent hydrolase
MGELLPYHLDRIIGISKAWSTNHQRDLKTVWNENIWVTTSGYFSLAPLACVLRTTSIDRIMCSVDWPLSTNESGLRFVEEVRKSGLVSEEGFEKFCYRNAEELLRVNVKVEARSKDERFDVAGLALYSVRYVQALVVGKRAVD